VTFNLKPEEHAILEKALAKVSQEMGKSLGKERVKPHEALLFLAKRVLETDPPEGGPSETSPPGESGRAELKTSPFTIVYQVCPDCRTAHVSTRDGPVEIPVEVVERVEGEARKVTIPPEEEAEPVPGEAVLDAPGDGRGEVKKDKPNTPALTRRALLRAGNTCENPMCGRTLGLHCHHLIFRSKGGPTSLQNTACVCVWCHATVHLGYLKVWKDRQGELHWEPRGDQLRRDFEAEAARISAVPVVQVQGLPGAGESEESTRDDSQGPVQESTRDDSEASTGKSTRGDFHASGIGKEKPKQDSPRKHDLTARPLRSIVGALRNLGWSARDAKERVLGALEFLESQGMEPSEEALLKKALAFRF
jgi:hypothetical protein